MLGTPGAINFAGRRLGQDNQQFYKESLDIDPYRLTELAEKGVL
jgi:hypothetical protein